MTWNLGSLGAAIASVALWAVPVWSGTPSACWDGGGAARLWPSITFDQAADLDDYRRTLSQNRDQVRRALAGEYLSILRELALAGGQPEAMIEPVLGALLAFDELHDRHREVAVNGVPVFLEVGVRSALDQLYRTNRVAGERRRLRWISMGQVERLGSARRNLRDPGGATRRDLGTLTQTGAQVDLIAHGVFSSDGESQHVALTLENLRTGAQCNFGVVATLEEAPYLLAEQVFQAFQAVEYPAVANPNPHLTWIRPGSGDPVIDPEQARFYCASQGEGVRLPYALELINAAQVGADGASYVEGGIPRLDPGPWVVADRLERDRPYYYFQPGDGRVDNHPAGAVRSGAGLGEVRARYWCVKGAPSDRVSRVEGLYELYRGLSRADPHDPALVALQYLLNREGALSARPRYRSSFPDEVSARTAVDRACFALEAKAAQGVTVAGLGCPITP